MDLAISELGFSYRKRPIFSNITFTASSGDVIGILGNNGCGKTTLLKVIAGLLVPKSGTVKVSEKRRTVFSGIIENPRMWGNLTGRENLIYYLRNDYDGPKADELLERFQLKEDAEKKVKNYSLGMRQKLAIIIAFLSSSGVLLLDEPTSSLDQGSIETFFGLVKEASEAGRIVIVVTHIIFELDKWCSHLYLMDGNGLEAWEDKIKDQETEIIRLEFETEQGKDKALKAFRVQDVLRISDREIFLTPTEESVGHIVERVSKCGVCGVEKRKRTIRDIYMEVESR